MYLLRLSECDRAKSKRKQAQFASIERSSRPQTYFSDLKSNLCTRHSPFLLVMKFGGPSGTGNLADVLAANTAQVAQRPLLSLRIAGVMEYYDTLPKPLLEVKEATGGTGALTPKERAEYAQHPRKLLDVNLADCIAAEIQHLSIEGDRPRDILQAVLVPADARVSTTAEEQLSSALGRRMWASF